MLSYCLKCKRNRESKSQTAQNTTNGKVMVLSECSACNIKKSGLIEELETRRLLRQLGIRLLSARCHFWVIFYFRCITMTSIINKLLFAGDSFVPEMHLRRPEFTFHLCTIVLVDHLEKRKQECKNLNKQETSSISTRTN